MICVRSNHFKPSCRFLNLFFLNSYFSSKPFFPIPVPNSSSSSNSHPIHLTSANRRPKSKPKSHLPSSPTSSLSEFEKSLAQLPPRFTSEDLTKALSLQKDPLACLQLFNWASQQPRFRHDVSTFIITLKKLGSSRLFDEFDSVVRHLLSLPLSSQSLFNTIIYFYTESRKLSKAISIFKHMKKLKDPDSRPSIKTYNLLFSAFLGRDRTNSFINHMYMETIRCLFRQMLDDGIEPDIFSLNAMIKGYVLSLHLNDALRIFHQMGVVFKCLPNAFSYDYLIHGLCAQGRSRNAMELYVEMKNKGFVPSGKAYNSLVNCLAIDGEVEEAVRILWEMGEIGRLADSITYQTVVDAMGRQGKIEEAMTLLRELDEREMINGHMYRKLMYFLQNDFGELDSGNGFGKR